MDVVAAVEALALAFTAVVVMAAIRVHHSLVAREAGSGLPRGPKA